jgi:hypothetical protein
MSWRACIQDVEVSARPDIILKRTGKATVIETSSGQASVTVHSEWSFSVGRPWIVVEIVGQRLG